MTYGSGRPPLCALQPPQSRRLSEPARLPAVRAACAALPQPAAEAVPEREPPGARADASITMQAEQELPHDKPGLRPGIEPDAHMADAQQELHNDEPGLLSGTASDVVMVDAERELHTTEPGVQPVAGPEAVMTDGIRGDGASAAAEAAVAAEAGSKQVACNKEWPQASAGIGSGLPLAEAAALGESGSEPHVKGRAVATAATSAADHLVGPAAADVSGQEPSLQLAVGDLHLPVRGMQRRGEDEGAAARSSRPGRAAAAAAEAQLPRPKSELDHAQLPFLVPALAGPTAQPGQQAQAATPQPGSAEGPVQEQGAGCAQLTRSSNRMASCSEAVFEGAAQEQKVVHEQAAAQEQKTGCEQPAAAEQDAGRGQPAAPEQAAGCGHPAAQEQEARYAPAPQPAEQQPEGQSRPGRARRYTRRMTRAAGTAGAAANGVQALPRGAKQRTLLAAMETGGAPAAGGWQTLQPITEEPGKLQVAQQQQQAIEGIAAAAVVQHQVAPAAALRRRSRAAVAAGSTAARAAPASSRQLMPGIAEESKALEADAMLQRQHADQVCAKQTGTPPGLQAGVMQQQEPAECACMTR